MHQIQLVVKAQSEWFIMPCVAWIQLYASTTAIVTCGAG
jgi:hypothetical protein